MRSLYAAVDCISISKSLQSPIHSSSIGRNEEITNCGAPRDSSCYSCTRCSEKQIVKTRAEIVAHSWSNILPTIGRLSTAFGECSRLLSSQGVLWLLSEWTARLRAAVKQNMFLFLGLSKPQRSIMEWYNFGSGLGKKDLEGFNLFPIRELRCRKRTVRCFSNLP